MKLMDLVRAEQNDPQSVYRPFPSVIAQRAYIAGLLRRLSERPK